MTHYNVQIHIQRVEPKTEARNPNGYLEKGLGGAPIVIEKKVRDLLNLSISADTEEEAYLKAMRLLSTNAPVPEPHLHRASCDDAGGNMICGFPPGPTI